MSKGVYLIGESDMSDKDRIIKHYLEDERGIPTGEYLLYTLGIVEEEQIEKTVKTNLSVGNKKIGNVQVIVSHSSFYEVIGAKKLISVLEILTMMNEIDSIKVLEVSNLIEEYLSDYRDSSFEVHVNDEYSRSVYLRLASRIFKFKIKTYNASKIDDIKFDYGKKCNIIIIINGVKEEFILSSFLAKTTENRLKSLLS